MKEYEVYTREDCICFANSPCQRYRQCIFKILIEDEYRNIKKEMSDKHTYKKVNGRVRQVK